MGLPFSLYVTVSGIGVTRAPLPSKAADQAPHERAAGSAAPHTQGTAQAGIACGGGSVCGGGLSGCVFMSGCGGVPCAGACCDLAPKSGGFAVAVALLSRVLPRCPVGATCPSGFVLAYVTQKAQLTSHTLRHPSPAVRQHPPYIATTTHIHALVVVCEYSQIFTSTCMHVHAGVGSPSAQHKSVQAPPRARPRLTLATLPGTAVS